MLSEHKFEYDGSTYRCARRMTPARPHTAYWDVVRSDSIRRRVWVPVGEEFDERRLEVETLREFGVGGS